MDLKGEELEVLPATKLQELLDNCDDFRARRRIRSALRRVESRQEIDVKNVSFPTTNDDSKANPLPKTPSLSTMPDILQTPQTPSLSSMPKLDSQDHVKNTNVEDSKVKPQIKSQLMFNFNNQQQLSVNSKDETDATVPKTPSATNQIDTIEMFEKMLSQAEDLNTRREIRKLMRDLRKQTTEGDAIALESKECVDNPECQTPSHPHQFKKSCNHHGKIDENSPVPATNGCQEENEEDTVTEIRSHIDKSNGPTNRHVYHVSKLERSKAGDDVESHYTIMHTQGNGFEQTDTKLIRNTIKRTGSVYTHVSELVTTKQKDPSTDKMQVRRDVSLEIEEMSASTGTTKRNVISAEALMGGKINTMDSPNVEKSPQPKVSIISAWSAASQTLQFSKALPPTTIYQLGESLHLHCKVSNMKNYLKIEGIWEKDGEQITATNDPRGFKITHDGMNFRLDKTATTMEDDGNYTFRLMNGKQSIVSSGSVEIQSDPIITVHSPSPVRVVERIEIPPKPSFVQPVAAIPYQSKHDNEPSRTECSQASVFFPASSPTSSGKLSEVTADCLMQTLIKPGTTGAVRVQVQRQENSHEPPQTEDAYQSWKKGTPNTNRSSLSMFRNLDQQSRAAPAAKECPPSTNKPNFLAMAGQIKTQMRKKADQARSSASIKQGLLEFCRRNTVEYKDKGVDIENFSSSWADGLAFCALIHHFYPESFDFNSLKKQNIAANMQLGFDIAEQKAGIVPLLDVEDMIPPRTPDWKCVFTYVQTIYQKLRNHEANQLRPAAASGSDQQ